MNKSIIVIVMMLSSIFSAQFIFAALRDPTQPPANIHGQLGVSPSLFTLNAVVIANDRKIAVINGLEKRVGDEILGQRVTAIYDNTVQLEGPSGKMTLFLFGKPIRTNQGYVGCSAKTC